MNNYAEKLQDDPRYSNFRRRHGRYACEVDFSTGDQSRCIFSIVTEHGYEYFNTSNCQELLDGRMEYLHIYNRKKS